MSTYTYMLSCLRFSFQQTSGQVTELCKLNFNQNGRRGKSDNDSFRADFCPRLSSGSVLSSYSQAGSSSQSHVYKDYRKFDRSEMRDAE